MGYQYSYAIYGERDAILVDTFLSVKHSKELADWIVESGKNLKTIYVIHAHGDSKAVKGNATQPLRRSLRAAL